MIQHYDEQALELYVLRAPEIEGKWNDIARHLEECPGCSQIVDEISGFYEGARNKHETRSQLPTIRPGWLNKTHSGFDLPAGRKVEIAFPVRAARWMVRHPVAAAGGFVGTVGLSAVLAFLAPKLTMDLTPVSSEVHDGTVAFYNRQGREIALVRVADLSNGDRPEIGTAQFLDVDGDGVNEALWYQRVVRTGESENALVCWSFEKAEFLWRHPLSYRFTFPQKPGDANSDELTIPGRIILRDCDRNGVAEIYALTNHPHFIRVLMQLDARSGFELGAYLHLGSISAPEFFDFNKDGTEEIIMAGTSQHYREAVIAILNPKRITGHSPTGGDYEVTDWEPADHYAYIRIPKTAVGQALGNIRTRSNAGQLEILGTGPSFRFTIDESEGYYPGTNFVAEVFITFNADLSVKEISVSDGYLNIAKRLVEAGKLSEVPGAGYLGEFSQKVLFWENPTGRWVSVLLPKSSL